MSLSMRMAVVEEAIGEVEEEVALQGLLQAMETHAVIKEAADDGVANAVGVFGSWFDAWDLRAKRLAAVASGAVFSDRQFDEDDLCVGEMSRTRRA